jgi:hypothetical protein
MSEEIKYDRRHFIGTAAMTIAAAQLSMFGPTKAQSSKINPTDVSTVKPGTQTSFSSLKQIDAGFECWLR